MVQADAKVHQQTLRKERWSTFPDFLTPPGTTKRRRGTPPCGVGTESTAPPTPTRFVSRSCGIDFATDRGGDLSTGNGRFDVSGPDTLLPPLDRPPHNRAFYQSHLEALSRYYSAQSYGRVVIVGDVWPRTRDGAYSASDMADFGPWVFGPDLYSAAVQMFRAFMFAADSQSVIAGDRIPWDDYDHFAIVSRGSDLQSDLLQDSPEDIPTFTIGVGGTDAVIFPDSANRPIEVASILPETATPGWLPRRPQWDLRARRRTQLLRLQRGLRRRDRNTVAGYWSLMDSGHLAGAIVSLPNDMLFRDRAAAAERRSISPSFHRTGPGGVRGGRWVTRSCCGPPSAHNDVRRVTLSSDEYLLLENRYLSPPDSVALEQDDSTRVVLGPSRPDRFEYDALLPGGGMLIWHVDEFVIARDYAMNMDSTRRGLKVVEADGLDDLGDPNSPWILGAPTDPWFVGNQTLLNAETVPALLTNLGADPNREVEVLDAPLAAMRVLVTEDLSSPTLMNLFRADAVADGIEIRCGSECRTWWRR